MDKIISDKGIDLMVVGIGMNGHIGLMSQPNPFGQYSRVVDLGRSTKRGPEIFPQADFHTRGITLGLNHLGVKKAILVANVGMADVVRKALKEKLHRTCPPAS
jgi:6-phosphogluconolactonase/glucosamine-6-phosphate isomerase/deaminase